MITRILYEKERSSYDELAHHPLQTWAWGDFAIKQGKEVVRLGLFNKEKLKKAYQLILSPLPKTNFTIGYLPRGPAPDEEMIKALKAVSRQHKTIFIRLEPNLIQYRFKNGQKLTQSKLDCLKLGLLPTPRYNFSPYSSLIDLTLSSKELLARLHPKTRYNINLATRHGVTVEEKTDDEGFVTYLNLTTRLTRRKGFFLHNPSYHRLLWDSLKDTGMLHLLLARYQDKVLAAYLLFGLKDGWYYPYGASSNEHKKVMASNLLMWETILLGRRLGFKIFDMWGTLGPNPDPKNPWYGFHRFKAGYGGQLVQYVGTWDLVLNLPLYRLYGLADSARQSFLFLRKKLRFT